MLDKIREFIIRAQQYSKAIVAAAGTLLLATADLSQTLGVTIVPADWQPYINFGIVILTAFATWRVPNVPATSTLTVGVDTGIVTDQAGISE